MGKPFREEALYNKKPFITEKQVKDLLILEPVEDILTFSEKLTKALEGMHNSSRYLCLPVRNIVLSCLIYIHEKQFFSSV